MNSSELLLETTTLHSVITSIGTDPLGMQHSSDSEIHFTEHPPSLNMSSVNSTSDNSMKNLKELPSASRTTGDINKALKASTANLPELLDKTTTILSSEGVSRTNPKEHSSGPTILVTEPPPNLINKEVPSMETKPWSKMDKSIENKYSYNQNEISTTELYSEFEKSSSLMSTWSESLLDTTIADSEIDSTKLSLSLINKKTYSGNRITTESVTQIKDLSGTMPSNDTLESSTENLPELSFESTVMLSSEVASKTDRKGSTKPVIEPTPNIINKEVTSLETKPWSEIGKSTENTDLDNQKKIFTTEFSSELKKSSSLTPTWSESLPKTTTADFEIDLRESTLSLINKKTYSGNRITTESMKKLKDFQSETMILTDTPESSEFKKSSSVTSSWSESLPKITSADFNVDSMKSTLSMANKKTYSVEATDEYLSKIQTKSPVASWESESEELIESGIWSTMNIDSSGNFIDTTGKSKVQSVSINQPGVENTSGESGMNSGIVDNEDVFPTLQPTKMKSTKKTRATTNLNSSSLKSTRAASKMPEIHTTKSTTLKSHIQPSQQNDITYKTSRTRTYRPTTSKSPKAVPTSFTFKSFNRTGPHQNATPPQILPDKGQQLDAWIVAGVMVPVAVLIVIGILGFVYYRKKKMGTYTTHEV